MTYTCTLHIYIYYMITLIRVYVCLHLCRLKSQRVKEGWKLYLRGPTKQRCDVGPLQSAVYMCVLYVWLYAHMYACMYVCVCIVLYCMTCKYECMYVFIHSYCRLI